MSEWVHKAVTDTLSQMLVASCCPQLTISVVASGNCPNILVVSHLFSISTSCSTETQIIQWVEFSGHVFWSLFSFIFALRKALSTVTAKMAGSSLDHHTVSVVFSHLNNTRDDVCVCVCEHWSTLGLSTEMCDGTHAWSGSVGLSMQSTIVSI